MTNRLEITFKTAPKICLDVDTCELRGNFLVTSQVIGNKTKTFFFKLEEVLFWEYTSTTEAVNLVFEKIPTNEIKNRDMNEIKNDVIKHKLNENDKIACIRYLRDKYGLFLKEAKEMTDIYWNYVV